jgi:hypothetical protein
VRHAPRLRLAQVVQDVFSQGSCPRRKASGPISLVLYSFLFFQPFSILNFQKSV